MTQQEWDDTKKHQEKCELLKDIRRIVKEERIKIIKEKCREEKAHQDKFTELVASLDSGELNLTHIQIAYRQHIKNSENVPDEVKSILCGNDENNSGLLYKHFALISSLVGSMELAVRRAKD